MAKQNGQEKSKNQTLIDLQQVVKKYAGVAGVVVALKGIDLQIEAGQFVAVTGKSGAGKTTLVNVVTGLDRSTSGDIWVDGQPVHRMGAERAATWRGETIGVVFQSFELLPTLTVLQNVTLPMDFAGKYGLRERRQRGMHLLEQMDIAQHAQKLPSAVSGGQRQRVAIARAMANDPPILVADEPTGSLDSVTAESVMEVFRELTGQGKTILLVTHDRETARQAQRTIHLVDGEIVGNGGDTG